MWTLLLCLISNVYGYILPAYASYKAIERNDQPVLTLWLYYWIVLGFFTVAEGFVAPFLNWIPFYHLFKTAFHIYLVAPQAQGALYIYTHVLDPWISNHEKEIDSALAQAQSQMAEAGIKYSQHAIAWLVQLVRSVVWGQQQAASSSSSISAPPATPAAPQGWNASAQNIASSIMNMVSGATVTQAAASRWSSSAPKLSSSALSREQKLNELYAMIEELKNAPPTPTGSAASSSSHTARPYKVGPDASGDEDDFEKVQAPANPAAPTTPTTPTSNSTWTSWLWRTPPPQGEKSIDPKGRSKEKVL